MDEFDLLITRMSNTINGVSKTSLTLYMKDNEPTKVIKLFENIVDYCNAYKLTTISIDEALVFCRTLDLPPLYSSGLKIDTKPVEPEGDYSTLGSAIKQIIHLLSGLLFAEFVTYTLSKLLKFNFNTISLIPILLTFLIYCFHYQREEVIWFGKCFINKFTFRGRRNRKNV